ncbi:type III pantothenate kinase [Spiroplasma endosymbiont of Panorpa germanica]|uniref:type III pantothenate kinase n=1 Tax=Spiroplasma endosymbiont of Panorpa germanica TaxID=3066314 RepID=UPI0030D158C8
MASTLLIDVGNTTVDFRVSNNINQEIVKLERIWTKDESKQNETFLKEIFKNGFEKIIFSSVVPNWSQLIYKVTKELEIPTLEVKNSFSHDCDDFKNISLEKLGSDFIANYYGVVKNLKLSDCVVVSMGTATTIFKIEKHKFQGTIIAAGLKIALESLVKNAALLSGQEFNFSNALYGQDTKTAIEIGSINGHFEMIKGLINNFKLGPDVPIIITGGNAHVLYDQFRGQNYQIIEELIFLGLQWLSSQKNDK